MDSLAIVGLNLVTLGVLVFGVFVVTKRQEIANDLLKEMVELLKK